MRRVFDRSADHQPARATILISALLAAVVLGALVYVAAVAPRGVPALPYYTLTAKFRNATQIRILSTVQIAGRRVGQVSDIRYDGGVANLELQLLPGTQQLRSLSTAQIRVKNPIGAKYVEITPSARGRILRSGDVIPVSQTSASVDTQTLLSAFDPRTRRNLGLTLVGLGKGFIGRGTGLNDTLAQSPALLGNLTAGSEAILARTGAAARLVPSADSLAQAYDPVRQELAQGFRPEADVLGTLSDRRTSIQQLLGVAPSSLRSLQVGLAQAQPLLDQTTGFAQATIRFTAPAPVAFRAATTLLDNGVPALQAARPLLRSLDTAVSPTTALLNTLDPVLAPSERMLRSQLAPLTTLVGHQCDFLTQIATWRSALSWGVPINSDPLSHLNDGEPGLGPNINSFRVLAVPETTTESLLPDSPGSVNVGRDPYPAPCAAPAERHP